MTSKNDYKDQFSFRISMTKGKSTTYLSEFLMSRFNDMRCLMTPAIDMLDEDDREYVIAVIESTSFGEIVEICNYFRNANKTVIYVIAWNDRLVLGPTHFPGRSAGADSCLLFLQEEALGRLPKIEDLEKLTLPSISNVQLQAYPEIFYEAFAILLRELKHLSSIQPGGGPTLIDCVRLFQLSARPDATNITKYIYPIFEKTVVVPIAREILDYRVLLAKHYQSNSHIEQRLFSGVERDRYRPEYNNVVIVGGGTAGYLTALSLKKAMPELPVTLIESSKIPVIGVGEATTPEIRRFLFDTLGFSKRDFYDKVKPTWKLGIKFFWGKPGEYYFNYPFGKSDIRSAYLINNDINFCSLTSLLMSNNCSFVTSCNDSGSEEIYSTLSDQLSFALHLDNAAFIGYLKEQAIKNGVIYIDDTIVDAEKRPECNELAAVIGSSGTRYEFDFFVDSSGFKSLLLEKVMGAAFIPYDQSLFTNTAVTGSLQNNKKVKPFTFAESMNNGWCWHIPMREEDHLGYVFSSNHCSLDKAIEELETKNPGIGNIKTVRFRSGRHENICIGNVFGVGNSFAFVEPLESTGIHMIIKEVETLTRNFPFLKGSPTVRVLVNKNLNDHWDYLKGFLSIHYKFNMKLRSAFWEDCRETVDISSIKWLIDLYHEAGLLSYAGESLKDMILKEIKDDIFGLTGFDTLLLGQGIEPRVFRRSLQNEGIWVSNVQTWKSILGFTVPLEKDLDILVGNPELI